MEWSLRSPTQSLDPWRALSVAKGTDRAQLPEAKDTDQLPPLPGTLLSPLWTPVKFYPLDHMCACGHMWT